MKKSILCTLMITLIIVITMTSCGKKGSSDMDKDSPVKTSSGKTAKTEDSTSSVDEDFEEEADISSDSSFTGLPTDLLQASWPTDLLPEELPEYSSGAITAAADIDGIIYIKIQDTNKSDLYVYLGRLQSKGWLVSSDDTEAEALLGPYTVYFSLQGQGDYLQIDVHTAEEGTWPADELPPDILPPETGTLVNKIEILESTQDSWYFDYTYDGIDEAAASSYMNMLLQNGWSGDDYMVFIAFEWKGKKYQASVEIYETLETRTTFTCNYWLVN